ncbi:MAG TPA: 2-aminobenzoate-CoA ligase, partial [Burkholderiaceae bacterium]|nr:2-aminobenzoate-CoA ligase [Burkholderiaceae bacterium]
MEQTAHVDTFARDSLPPPNQWPELLFNIPDVQYPTRLNCAVELLDRQADGAGAERIALQWREGDVRKALSYGQLLALVNRIAHVLVDDMG